jgi:glutaredoxin
MASFKIITNKSCPFCKKLKKWLGDHKVKYTEIDYHDDALNEVIENDESFAARYCDMSACIDSTPIIIKNDKEYYYGEIWDFQTGTIREDKAKRIFEV